LAVLVAVADTAAADAWPTVEELCLLMMRERRTREIEVAPAVNKSSGGEKESLTRGGGRCEDG
jgi:hypothetical protein